MNSQSIEFDKINEDSSLPKIVRKAFRVPVEDTGNFWVVINAKRYPLRDFSMGGIGIVLDDLSAFTIEQTLENCELNIFNTCIKNLSGRVVHLSPNPGQVLLCGIEWVNVKEEIADEISTIVRRMKEQSLTDDNVSFDSI